MFIIILHFVILRLMVNAFLRYILFNMYFGVKEICNLLGFIRPCFTRLLSRQNIL